VEALYDRPGLLLCCIFVLRYPVTLLPYPLRGLVRDSETAVGASLRYAPPGETPAPALFGPGPAPGRRWPFWGPGTGTGPRREGLM